MAAPQHGALGWAFTSMRAMQFVSLITIIGLTGKFISDIVEGNLNTPPALIGTMVISTLATIYLVITYILYWDNILPMLVAVAGDAILTIATIVVACVIGRPTSYLKCSAFPTSGGDTATFINSVFQNVKNAGGNVFRWVNPSQTSCFQFKAIWGLSIALAVLFFFTSVICACLWKRLKAPKQEAPKDFE